MGKIINKIIYLDYIIIISKLEQYRNKNILYLNT